MAGETTLSSNLTTAQGGQGSKVDARYSHPRTIVLQDTAAYATGELESNDVKLYNIKLPTNAIVSGVEILCDDLDGSTGAVIDVGYFAFDAFTSVTSGTATKHAQNAVLDADALVDGSTATQSAVTAWTELDLDTATMGPDDLNKEIWQVLGYDADPFAYVVVGVTIATAPSSAQAGDVALRVTANIPD